MPTWDEPASACLSSRIPYFSEVTEEKLRMIERAETRAARPRLPHLPRAAPRHASRGSSSGATRSRARSSRRSPPRIDRELRALGYAHVTVDLRGYRLGSLNDALRLRPVDDSPPCASAGAALAAALPRRAPRVPARDARRHRLDQLRARRARLRRRAAPAASARLSRLHRARRRSRRALLRAAGVDAAEPRGLAIWSALAGAAR